MGIKRKLAAAAVVAAIGLSLAQHAAAGNFAQTTYLTVGRPVQLPGVALGAGTYIFELADATSARHIVRVMSRDRKQAYFLGFTNPIERPRGMSSDASISLSESAADVAPRVTAWWPGGDRTGYQFIYRAR